MKANDTVKFIMSSKGITQETLMKSLGVKSQSGISQTLNRDMRISSLVRFLSAMSCEVVIKDKDSGLEYTVDDG